MNSNNSNHSRAASAWGFLARCAITPLAALGILAGAVPATRAADALCPPNPATGATINGNLVVPAGATCGLAGPVTVTGNVQVGKGANLNVGFSTGQTVTIGGNVQANQCGFVNLVPVLTGAISVGGNVQIRNCTFESGYNAVEGTLTISGNFACDNNSGACFALSGSVRGNVQVDDNTAGSGPGAFVQGNNVGGNVQVDNNSASGGANNFVSGNTIGGNLQCARNTPGVTDNSVTNTVAGNKQGQCAGASF
jgi:hypothetical protein